MNITKNFFKYLFFIFLFLKRFFYFFKKTLNYAYLGLKWIFHSKEHTSFSFEIPNELTNSIIKRLSVFIECEKNEVEKLIKFLDNINFNIPKYSNFQFKTADIDYKNKYDYRVLPFSIFYLTKVKYLIEFGFNQGRLLYLLNDYFSNNHRGDFEKKYIGLDLNTRKGGLFENINLDIPCEIYFEKVEKYLTTNKEYLKSIMNESILVCSTHESESENFIFEYLKKNKIFPMYIISDNVKENSNFWKYFINNLKKYDYEYFTFYSSNIFYDNLEIGVLKRLT